mmetsp:Transcript_28090/g.51837  ORF Transcript_28090/g.51837 Transcript_28090/m.51837 type:complete len:263 (+) Transcript_28090:429-1217(+)
MAVEAHRDVDEEAASVRGERRYPTHSIIVYLDMEEKMRGTPTCLWVPAEKMEEETSTSTATAESALVAVPAVPGRLLVFSGELLHAVPCPTLSWLDPPPTIREGGGIDPADTDRMRRVLVLNLWDDFAPKDEEEEDWDDEEEDDWDDDDDEEDGEPIEFFAKRVECEPRQNWQPVALQGPSLTDDKTAAPSDVPMLTLSTRSHGSDEPFLSPLKATTSRTALAEMLESQSIPQWLWTGADVRDLGIGVPSLAGSRAERTEYF